MSDNIFERPSVVRAFARANQLLGERVCVDGKPYTGVVGELRVTREMVENGYDPGYNLSVVITLDQMPKLPPTDQRPVSAEYKGRKYLLKDPATIDAVGVTLYLQNDF